MFSNRKRRLVALTTTALFCLSTTSIYAASTTKTLKAIFNGIRVSYNGQVKSSDKEPFIVDGTTYVPIRMVGELVGKTVKWDGTNKQILITGNDSTSTATNQYQSQQISNLTAQIAQKDIELIRLKQEKAALEQQIITLQTKANYDKDRDKDKDLDDLEDDLMDDYEKYKRIKFDISLSGDEDDVDLRIKVDLDDYDDEWDDLDKRDIEDYVEDICNDIWDVYDDADIDGDIYDTDERERVVEFESKSRHRLDFDFDNYKKKN